MYKISSLSTSIIGLVALVLIVIGSSFYYVKSQSILNDKLTLAGGAVLNASQTATSGLVVRAGYSGFGIDNPTTILDVVGDDPRFLGTNFIFNHDDAPGVLTIPVEIETNKLEVESIYHTEAGVSVQYITEGFAKNCEPCSTVVYDANGNRLAQMMSMLFGASTAEAAPNCMVTCDPVPADTCPSGWTEDSSGNILQQVRELRCDGSGVCLDPSISGNYSDYGTVVSVRKCVGPGDTEAEALKIKFQYDKDIAENTTTVYDNFQSVDNIPESCGFEAGPICSNGKFMAGYNPGVGIYCCEL